MATILEFRHEHRQSARQRNGSAAPADIVFFPGVRYERWDEMPGRDNPKKQMRRRDKLQIDD